MDLTGNHFCWCNWLLFAMCWSLIAVNLLNSVVKEDEEHAFKLFEKAAERGHIAAKFMVADCLLNAVSHDLKTMYVQVRHPVPCSSLLLWFAPDWHGSRHQESYSFALRCCRKWPSFCKTIHERIFRRNEELLMTRNNDVTISHVGIQLIERLTISRLPHSSFL